MWRLATAIEPVEDPLGGDAGGLEGRVLSPEEHQQGVLVLVHLVASYRMWQHVNHVADLPPLDPVARLALHLLLPEPMALS